MTTFKAKLLHLGRCKLERVIIAHLYSGKPLTPRGRKLGSKRSPNTSSATCPRNPYRSLWRPPSRVPIDSHKVIFQYFNRVFLPNCHREKLVTRLLMDHVQLRSTRCQYSASRGDLNRPWAKLTWTSWILCSTIKAAWWGRKWPLLSVSTTSSSCPLRIVKKPQLPWQIP